jgi:D-aminoacyl-tRNA deacylase
MKIVIQRVTHAKVEVDGKTTGAIEKGALVFFGVTHSDTLAEVKWLANKLVNLRMFADDEGKMNKSLQESKGEVLIVSQFTLYGNCSEGRRPSFTEAAEPHRAQELYELFIDEVQNMGVKVETGLFGAHMEVALLNDGPVTFVLEREQSQ